MKKTKPAVEVLLRKLLQRQEDEVVFIRNVTDQEIIFVSQAYENIWGRSCLKLYENTDEWLNSIHLEDKKRLNQQFFNEISELPQPVSCEYRIIRPDGEVRWILEKSWLLLNEYGEAIAIGGVARDISLVKAQYVTLEDKLAQQCQKAEEEENFFMQQGNLLALHVNELMTIAQKSGDLALSAEMRNLTSSLYHHALQVSYLLNDTFAYFHVDEDDHQNQNVAFNLYSTLESLNDSFTEYFASKGVRFVLKVASETHLALLGDMDKLKRCLRYLVLFLCRYEGISTLALVVSSLETTENASLISFSLRVARQNSFPKIRIVGDTEIKTKAEEKICAYSSHFMLAKTILCKLGGVLALKEHVDGEEAQIKLEFIHKCVTERRTFSPYEPRVEAISEAVSQSMPIVMKPPKVKKNIAHTLVVEDNVINQHLVAIILNEIGCSVDVASDGNQALAMSDKDYDLVFVDIGLPGMDGFKVAQKLKSQFKNKYVPIIGMSAHMCLNSNEENVLGPLDDFIYKPFGMASVNELVEKWVINYAEKAAVG